MSPRRLLLIALVVMFVAWALAPAIRGGLLVARRSVAPDRAEILAPLGATEDVTFRAADGVKLAGTYVDVQSARGVVILVHGFKTYRQEMVDHARSLRGAGWMHIAVLGISLGAGVALLATAKDDRIQAVIADSSWADEDVQLERMTTIPVGPLAVPVLPYEAALVDVLIGGRLEDARPIDIVDRIAPRSLLLIHSMDDDNATTPPADAERLFAQARQPKEFWRVPTGGHVGALRVHPDEYRLRVLAFLEAALR